MCDLPDEYLTLHNIGIMYFYITTNTGHFRDGFKITAGNILEYLENGGKKAQTNAPEPQEYQEFFESQLKKYEKIIHISITSKVSFSYQNAQKARENMTNEKDRIFVLDSKHLSTGMAHIIMRAVEMRDSGCSPEEIIEEAKLLRSRISTSFITKNADYLYRNGRTSKKVRNICRAFRLHPVLTLRDDSICLKTVRIGNYDKSVMRYVRSELRHSHRIQKRRIFITHAGCTVKMVSEVQAEVERLGSFDEVLITKASATVSSNCGMGTIGVLFVREER